MKEMLKLDLIVYHLLDCLDPLGRFYNRQSGMERGGDGVSWGEAGVNIACLMAPPPTFRIYPLFLPLCCTNLSQY